MIELPADSNPLDNSSHFVFAEPPVQETVIVSDDFAFTEAVKLAADAPLDRLLKYSVKSFGTAEANQIEWDKAAMVVWHGELPEGLMAQQLQSFADDGKSILFFPPKTPGGNELFGYRWTEWDDDPAEVEDAGTWRTDAGILQNTQDGNALPVGDLKVYRHCEFEGSGSALARLQSGSPLLSRATTDRGSVWFCGTLPMASHSSLARDGVVFYVMLHRAINTGAQALGQARTLNAGKGVLGDVTDWNALGGSGEIVPSALAYNSGAFKHERDSRLVALNRPDEEDTPRILNNEQLETLLEGVEYQRIDDKAGSEKSLASEIWKMFLILLGVAVIAEAILCLPDKKRLKPVAEAA